MNDGGDHSILVDAAAVSSDAQTRHAGIRESTINLTVIDKRSSRLRRLVRSLFARQPAPALRPSPLVNIKARAVSPSAADLEARSVNRFIAHQKKAVALNPKHKRNHVVAPRGVMAEQEAIYRAAVAALSDVKYTPSSTATSEAVFATPSPNVLAAVVSQEEEQSSTVEPSAPSSEVESAPRAGATTVTLNPKSSSFVAASREPITLTVTLVADPTGGAGYVDQAGLAPSSSSSASIPTATLAPAASSSAEQAATTDGATPQRFAKFKRSKASHARRGGLAAGLVSLEHYRD